MNRINSFFLRFPIRKQIGALLAVAALSSCSISSEDIRLGEVNNVRLDGMTLSQARVIVDLTVANDSRTRVVVKEGNLTVSDINGPIAEVSLSEEIILRRKTSETLELPLVIRFNGMLGSLSALPRLQNNPAGLTVNGTLRAKGGAMGKKWKIRNMPLPNFLEMLGIYDLNSLKSLNLPI